MPTKPLESRSATAVPIEYAGKWIAWSSDHSRIVAHADRLQDVWQIVRKNNVDEPIFEKVPRADVRFVGTR